MAWIVVALALILAFGPMLYLLPTRKDRRLAAMRMTARRLGLVVELKPVRKLDAAADERVSAGGIARSPVHQSVAYRLPLRKALSHIGPWRLLRSQRGGWQFDVEFPVPGEADFLKALPPLEGLLPDDVVAVECVGRDLSCYWLEQFPADGETVGALGATLSALAEQLIAKDEEIAARLTEADG